MEKILHGTIITGGERSALLARAWELAEKLLCARAPEGESCGECEDCRKVRRQIHPDVTLINRLTDKDGKLRKELLIEQIRALEKDAVVLPNEAERKVYILPEAELLNDKAQNAFLKLLEEPPEFVSFLLCAANVNLLLPTIRSRCAVVRCSGGEAGESDKLLRLAEDYLRSIGDDTAMLRACVPVEKLDSADFRALISLLRLHAPQHLSGQALLALEEQLSGIARMLTVNVSVKHATALLGTYRFEE